MMLVMETDGDGVTVPLFVNEPQQSSVAVNKRLLTCVPRKGLLFYVSFGPYVSFLVCKIAEGVWRLISFSVLVI